MSKLLMLLLCTLLPMLVLPSCTKAQARTANEALTISCELLAADVASQTNRSVDEVIEKTCAVERFTRKLRDALLAQQMRELYRNDGLAPAAPADPYHGVEETAEPAE